MHYGFGKYFLFDFYSVELLEALLSCERYSNSENLKHPKINIWNPEMAINCTFGTLFNQFTYLEAFQKNIVYFVVNIQLMEPIGKTFNLIIVKLLLEIE